MRWPFWKRDEENGGANTPGAAISAYLDGEVTPAERAQIEGELSAQPDLTTTLDALQDVKALLRAMPEERPRRSFALTAEMAGAAEPTRLPERVRAPKRTPFLLYAGQAAAGIGVLGLMVVGASTMFGGSSDESGDFAAIAANKDGHESGDTMSGASTLAEGDDAAGGSAPGAPESTSGDGEPTALTDTAPLAATADAGVPDQESSDQRNGAPAAEETSLASSMQMTAAYDAPPEDNGGPSGRQIAFIVFGLIAAVGGGAWLALAMHIRKQDGAQQV